MSINSVIQRKGLGTNHSFMRQASYCFFLSCTKENFSSSHLLFHLQQVWNFETRCGFRSIIWCGVIMNLLKKDLLDSYIAPRNWQWPVNWTWHDLILSMYDFDSIPCWIFVGFIISVYLWVSVPSFRGFPPSKKSTSQTIFGLFVVGVVRDCTLSCLLRRKETR